MSNIGKEGRNETSAHFAGDVLQSFSVYGSFCWYPDTTSLLRRPHEISSVQVVHLFVRVHHGERPVSSRSNRHDSNLQSVKYFCSKNRQPCHQALTRFVRSRVTRTYAAVSPMAGNRNFALGKRFLGNTCRHIGWKFQAPVAYDGLPMCNSPAAKGRRLVYNKVCVVSTRYTVKLLAASVLRALVSSVTCRKRQVRGERRLP